MNVYLYQNNTEKVLKNIYIGEYGWKPGDNTVLYLPLENDTADHSQYSRTITQSGTVTKSDIGYLFAKPSSGENALKCSDTVATLVQNFPYTISIRGKMQATGSTILYWGSVYYNSGLNLLLDSSNNKIRIETYQGSTINQYWYNVNTVGSGWHNYVFCIDSSSTKVYMDGTLVATHSYNQTLSTLAGGILQYNIGNGYTGMYWSDFIIEKGGWSAQEIQDYYNLTKSDYGL